VDEIKPANFRSLASKFSRFTVLLFLWMVGLIVLWDLARGRRFFLSGHREGVGEIQFSHDDRTLFSTSTDHSLRLWNVATRQEMISLTDEETFELALSPDDTVLAVSGVRLQDDPRVPPVKLWHAPALKTIDATLLPGRK